MIAAELHPLNGAPAAREMYGRGYFHLDDLRQTTAAKTQAVSPEFLAAQQAPQAMHSQAPTESTTDLKPFFVLLKISAMLVDAAGRPLPAHLLQHR
jgi:hypothetical protein